MQENEEIFSIVRENLQILGDTYSKKNVSAFSSDYLLEERSQNLSNWLKGLKKPNMEKLAILFVTIPDLSLEWFFRRKGKMLLSEEVTDMMIKEAEFKELKKREKMYEGIIQKGLGDFHKVYAGSQLVDNIEALDSLDVITRNTFLGNSFYRDLSGNS